MEKLWLKIAAPVVMAILIVVAITTVGANRAISAPTAPNAEQQFFDLINQERARAGQGRLAADGAAASVARDWSVHMATTGTLAHRPDLAGAISGRVTDRWTRIGENVGHGGSVDALHRAFMASPSHRNNVLGGYNRVGVAVTISGESIWVTMNFVNGPAL